MPDRLSPCPPDIIEAAKLGRPAAKYARKFWSDIGPLLVRDGRLAQVDYPAFEALAWTWGSLRACELLLAEEGETISNLQERGDGVRIQAHPASAARNKHRTQFFVLAQQFGLTPKSRGQIKVVPTDDDEGDSDLT